MIREDAKTAVLVYKKTGLELARILWEINNGGDYKEWGFDTIEDYASVELRIKKPTLKKYLIAYEYAKSRNLLETENAPEVGTLCELSKASKNNSITDEELKEIECSVISGNLDEKEARKEIKQMRKPQSLPNMEDDVYMDKIIRSAKRIYEEMTKCHKVPDTALEIMDKAIKEMESVA